MPQQSFRELGVSSRIADALAARSIVEPFPIQRLRPPGRDRRTGHPREVADRLGEDARVRHSDRGAHQLGTSRRRLVLVPTRELAQQVTDELDRSPPERTVRGARLRRRAASSQAKRARRRTSSSRPQDVWRTFSTDACSSSAPSHPGPRRGRPNARHGLPASGRPDREARLRDRQTMFFSATLDERWGSSPPRTRTPPGTESRRRAAVDSGDHTGSSRSPGRQGRDPGSGSCKRRRARPSSRPDEARRRRLVRKL